MKWDYDWEEVLADGIVHGLGVLLGLVSTITLFVIATPLISSWKLTSVIIYSASLLAVLVISALYNLWPVSPAKWILRRFDHSAIYLLIAGTYTPFLTQMKAGFETAALMIVVWGIAVFGITLKLVFPGRFERLSIVLYLAAGWSGIMAYESIFGSLTNSTLWLLVAGGVLYTTGVVFHLWESLRFQNAIWHAFVLVAAACHYGAVLDGIVLT